MCTVSWTCQSGGYDLFFSRDEQRTRALGERPNCQQSSSGVSFLAPRDPQGGGTWIFSNEFGLTACLLNSYPALMPPGLNRPTLSRGRLLLELVSAADLAECDAILAEAFGSATYAACFLLVVSPGGELGWWIWSGEHLHRVTTPPCRPITTSSWDRERVCARRREQFLTLTSGSQPPTVRQLRLYHEASDQGATAESVRMSRLDARTVSLTHVICREDSITMEYAMREGDAGFAPASTHTLALAASLP